MRQLSGHYSEPVEQQPENGVALAQGPTQVLRGIMEDGAGGPAVETTARLMIEFMGGQLDRRDKLRRHAGGGAAPPVSQATLKLRLPFRKYRRHLTHTVAPASHP